ncbi:MAG: glycosyltransferase, partial [Nitrosopumilus sp.]
IGGDFILFHHFPRFSELKRSSLPKVFWGFDLIDWPPDPSLNRRSSQRKGRMGNITRMSQLGFLSDGDWIANDDTGKLVHLFQGADTRITGFNDDSKSIQLMFTGTSRGGVGRQTWVDQLRLKYKGKFLHVEKVYREDLAEAIGKSMIVLAPDSPTTNLYWSNRVYVKLGFGAFLLHPYCELLATHYEDREEIVFYRSRDEMHSLINYYLRQPEERQRIALAGYERTIKEHTYIHRCKKLIDVVTERLF